MANALRCVAACVTGVVYEKDLGPGTDALARRIAQFNPGTGWARVEVPLHASATAQAPQTNQGSR